MLRRCVFMAMMVCLAFAGDAWAQQAAANLTGRFSQERYLQGFNAPLRSEGGFVLAPGRGLIWRIEQPFAMVTLIGPAGLVQQVNGRETMRLPADRMPLLGQIHALLGAALNGDWQEFEALNFDIAHKAEGEGWRAELTPRGGALGATGIRRIVAHGRRFVETLEMEKQGGDRDRLVFFDHALSPQPLATIDADLLDQLSPR